MKLRNIASEMQIGVHVTKV